MNTRSLQDCVKRFERTVLTRIEDREETEPRITQKEIADQLLKGNFPQRHVRQNRTGLYGPGLEKAKALWPRIHGGDALLLLIGDRGPGKTQMSVWWAAKRAESGKSTGLYIKCADLIGEIKATWHDGGKSLGTEQDVLRKYRRAKYLVIDEFHDRGGSEWESRCLVNLLDHRYDDMLATVLIANLTPENAALEINPSVLSRANQTGGMVLCDWPSYRKIL